MSTSARTSDLQTATTQVGVGANRINSLILFGDGTNAPTLTIYDHASAASGKVVAKIVGKTTDVYLPIVFTKPLYCENGIRAVLAGTGASFIVHYGA